MFGRECLVNHSYGQMITYLHVSYSKILTYASDSLVWRVRWGWHALKQSHHPWPTTTLLRLFFAATIAPTLLLIFLTWRIWSGKWVWTETVYEGAVSISVTGQIFLVFRVLLSDNLIILSGLIEYSKHNDAQDGHWKVVLWQIKHAHRDTLSGYYWK